jgi:SAM-dependent methyltransferase
MPDDNLVEIWDEWIISRYRKKYGPGFIFEVDMRDEMYRDHLAFPTVGQPVLDYYKVGEAVMEVVGDMIRHAGIEFGSIRSVLDFASGYGRVTRFLIQKVPPSFVTVSDIDCDAVDFCRKAFGVQGFYSSRDPEDCRIPGQYDLIIVISLFSHLSFSLWDLWMRTLYGAVAEDGVMIFTTHGSKLLRTLKIESSAEVAEGFNFLPSSETGGRLSVEDYGSSFVSERFVRRFFIGMDPGASVDYYPEGLLNFQDVYVVKKTRNRPLAGSVFGRLIKYGKMLNS